MAKENDPSLFLWHELCETTEEKFYYIENEINHYKIIFQNHNMHILKEIILEIENELSQLKLNYLTIVNELNNRINDKVESMENRKNSYLYDRFLVYRSLLNEIMERLKYIIYSIFDSDVRRRLDQYEIVKNHQISRNLCNYIIKEKVKNSYAISIESHYGYELGYYWKELTLTKKGIINAPRNNAFYTRFLPIYGHEVSHPIIELNTKKILEDPILQEGYKVSQDFILKHIEVLNYRLNMREIQELTSTIYSEILADLFSTILFGESFVFAFAGSDLVPHDTINAQLWLESTAWTSHPPNSLRFKLCTGTLKELKNNENFKILNTSWEKVSKLEKDFKKDSYTNTLNLFIKDYIKEFQLRDVIKRLLEPESPVLISKYEDGLKDKINDIKITDDPISIIRSIWKIRYLRWVTNSDLSERETTKYLKILHYALEMRR